MIQKETAKQWFMEDRFGMFIHWGLYSIPARGEWVRSTERIDIESYEKYFNEFDPVRYDPKQWAKAAKAAGMKYAVMTAKHHDGFCLFDSAYTDYKATNTPAKRDLIREYVEAFRAEGLKVGLYYSLLDWHHPDYPAYDDLHHPMRKDPRFEDHRYDFSNYVTYLHQQVRELLTNYGTIDVMWFDFSYDGMSGERWKATDLMHMIRSLQPNIVIDNRLGGNLRSKNPEIYAGDFASPEQILPIRPITNEAGENIPWEACITLNDHWGYCSNDHYYKSAKTVIRTLINCVSKNGNLLLNVGPDAYGEIPKESLEILEEVGQWMSKNGESIYGCKNSSLPKPEWGYYTQKGDTLYAHIFERGIGPILLADCKDLLSSARLLSDGAEVNISVPWNGHDFPKDAFLNLVGCELPDDRSSVYKLTLKNC